jgi:hypothetical protein
MRKTIIFLTFLLTVNCLSAQITIGVKYDINGMPLNGYFDPIIYSPDKKISKVHNSDSYEKGYYYDSLGSKIVGLIKFENDKIFFKKNEEDFRIKIRPDEIRNFVIGVDSFFVVDKFYFQNSIKENPEFVQYVTDFDGYTYAKHYHFTSGMAQQYAMQPPIIETFLVKHNDSLIWDNFPNRSTFKERALKYFSHIPYLKHKISSGEYDSEDMLSVIKMAEYFDKYINSKPIYYDRYWQEVIDIDKAVFTAKITNKVDSIWTFEYYKDKEKIYEGSYSSFYPNTKNGDFKAFYPNGETRQIVTFSENKPKKVKTFYPNGSLCAHYDIIETQKTYRPKTSSSAGPKTRATVTERDIDIKYIVVNDSAGVNILNSKSSPILTINDDLNGVTYTCAYNVGELSSVYRILGNDTVFQIAKPDYDFKINSLQKKFDYFMLDKKYDDALSENAQGIILVSLLIDKKGYVLESSVLNELHPELDSIVNKFISSRLSISAENRYKFKPYKKDKEKMYCEVVIPFEFNINRFYRRPVSYNHFNHWYFHDQIMQQQMMNNFRPPTPPKMPSRF